MKLLHVLILSASILIGCCVIAFARFGLDRHEYIHTPVEGRLGRVNRFTGAVEIYDKNRGWFDVSQ
jgi:hypothetical protein